MSLCFVLVLVLKSMSILPPAIVLYHDISGNLQSEPILVLIIVIRDSPLEKKTLHPQHPTLYRDDGEPAPSLSGLGHTACRPTPCPASEKTKATFFKSLERKQCIHHDLDVL